MKWTAWNNSSWSATGGGYGLRLRAPDRDQHFDRSWTTVELELPGAEGHEVTEVNVSEAFWRRCPELRGQRIGQWLIARGLAPWPKGRPPKLTVEIAGPRRFRVVP